jgi:beta-N-acetylhexosaminidase
MLLVISFSAFAGIENMTIEEKVGQFLMVHFCGEEVNEEAERLIEEAHVGGFAYYNWANGLTDPLKVQRLSCSLQKRSPIPLFLAVDQEGGRVSWLKEQFTAFPDNETVGMTEDSSFAEACAFAIGEELRAVGINVDFAPVVDINSNPMNRVIGSRSYGSSPEKVTLFGKSALEGFRRAGVFAVLKHFPGLGDTKVDSHLAVPRLDKSKKELFKVELFPYQKLAKEADLIMTAHVLVPVFDSNQIATLSAEILQGLLRKELGYEGVIISDSLVMEGFRKSVPNLEEGALRAFEAGCDLLILAGGRLSGVQERVELSVEEVLRIHKAFVNAVRSERIPMERVDASLRRIFRLKERLLKESPQEEIALLVGTKAHQELVERIIDCVKQESPLK